MAYQLQNKHYIFVCYLFSQPVNFSSDPFCYSQLTISFCSRYTIKFKEVVDLRFVHPNAAQLQNLTYFSQNPQIQNWCIQWWEICSLAVHYFPRDFFQFIFVLPARYVRMRNFLGKSKQMQAVYMKQFLNVIKVLLVYNPKYSSCFPPGQYLKNTVFDLMFK